MVLDLGLTFSECPWEQKAENCAGDRNRQVRYWRDPVFRQTLREHGVCRVSLSSRH